MVLTVKCSVYTVQCTVCLVHCQFIRGGQLCPGEQGVEGKGWGQMEGGQGAVPAPPAGHRHTAQACSMGNASYKDHTSDPL